MMANCRSRRSLIGWALLALFNCAVVMPWLSRGCLPPFDFGAFYSAAKLYQEVPGSRLYDLQLQLQAQQKTFPTDGITPAHFFPFYHLPYELLLWLPLTGLSYSVAFWVWRAENLALLLLTAWLLARTLELRRGAKFAVLVLLAFFPLAWCLLMGQDTLLIVALYAVCLTCLKSNRELAAGAVLGLGLFKFQFILPIIAIMLLRRSWRVVAGFTSSAAIVLGVSTAMVGGGGMHKLAQVWLTGEGGAISSIQPTRMPNLRGLIASVPGLAPHSPIVVVTAVFLSACLLFAATRQAKMFPDQGSVFAGFACFVILAAFHVHLYDLALLVIPILLLLNVDVHAKPLQWRVLPPLFLLVFTPLYVVVLALSAGAPLAILTGWLWYGIGCVGKQREVAQDPARSWKFRVISERRPASPGPKIVPCDTPHLRTIATPGNEG